MLIPHKQARGDSTGRIVELDSLRGLAALAVLLFHFTTRYDQLFGWSSPLAMSVPWGFYGVELFFMLSGFVILRTLDRTRGTADFAVNRFARLYPAYWASAALTFLVVAVFGLPGQQTTWKEALVNLTMVQRALGAPHVDGAYWSLQAELFFYAGALILHRTGAFRHLPLTLMAWLAAAGSIAIWIGPDANEPVRFSLVLARLQSVASLKYIHLFAIGMLLYRAQQTGRMGWQSGAVVAVALLQRAALESWHSACVVAGLALMLHLAVSGRLRFLNARPLTYLGAISYTLYLVHQNIGYVLIRELEGRGVPPIFSIAAAIALSVILAIAVRAAVERPAMACIKRAWKRWQEPRLQQSAPQPVAANITANVGQTKAYQAVASVFQSSTG